MICPLLLILISCGTVGNALALFRRRRDDGNARWSRNVLCRVASVRRYASRSAWCVLIRGLWFGAAFHNGRARRILDRNAARQPWVTRSGELRNRGRRDARTRRGRSWRADSWRVGLGISTREKNVRISGRFIPLGEQGLRQNNLGLRGLPGGGRSPAKPVYDGQNSLFIREIYFYCGSLARSKWSKALKALAKP